MSLLLFPSLRLGWRTLRRDLRAGDLRLLIIAVTLAVAALTAVGFFADRLHNGLQRDALQLLGRRAGVLVFRSWRLVLRRYEPGLRVQPTVLPG